MILPADTPVQEVRNFASDQLRKDGELGRKPPHIHFDVGCQVRLIDFGISRQVKWGKIETLVTKRESTPEFSAPEMDDFRPNVNSDFFALGLVLCVPHFSRVVTVLL